MKKIFSITMMFAMMLMMFNVCCADRIYNDDFTLHSGIKFGMNMNDVMSLEKSAGFEPKKDDMWYTFYDEEGNYKARKVTGVYVEGSIASIDGSKITYIFNENDCLFDVIYIFKGTKLNVGGKAQVNEDIIDEYEKIQKQLDKKYEDVWEEVELGEYTTSLDYLTKSEAIYDSYSYKIRVNDNECIYLTHWLTFLEMNGMDSFDYETLVKAFGQHYLEYRLITDDELERNSKLKNGKQEREMNEKKKEEDEKERQLNDDI